MVFPVSQFFFSRTGAKTSNRPLLAGIPTSIGGSRLNTFPGLYRQFFKWFVTSPELVATISIPITDIMGDRPEWTTIDGKKLGRNKLMKAQKFWRDNRGKETLKAYLYDAFVTGDGYLWMAEPEVKEIRRVVRAYSKGFKNYMNESQLKELEEKAVQDEDLKLPKKFDYVASSTVTILRTEFEIIGYEQKVNNLVSRFTPEEIIHYRYMTINGFVQGFSPVEALWSEIMLLTLVKENMISFMRNGGSPDKIFTMPKEIAGSKNHKYLIEVLQKYKKITNWHGSMVFTGEMSVDDLQGKPKDLEYKDLALYITSNIAYAYGIPVSRIPYLIGSQAVKGDSGGLSETGYWNRISDLQDTIEDLLNNQLFGPMGWHISFQRKYKQDEVRESQTNSMNADTVTKYESILKANDLQLTDEKILDLLGMAQEDVEDFEMSEVDQEETNLRNQNMLGNDQMNKEPDALKKAQNKRNVANQKGSREAVTQS